jgi:hypothetical protein
MSDYFSGVTFAEQSVTPSDDAIMHRAVLTDGLLRGCAFNYAGSTLSMGVGSLLICGRQARHTAAQSWAVTDATSGFARLLLTADLSRTSTKDAFDQLNESIEYAASLDGFPALEQADINEAGTVYQMELCVVSLGSGGITGIVRTAPQLSGAGFYAPSGFGLGQENANLLTSLAELDTLTKTGFYGLDLPIEDSELAGCYVRKATVSVEGYDGRMTLQRVSVVGTTTSLERWRTAGSWGPWSVQNPPMALGQEYRTTRNWSGQPVYVKRLGFAASNFAAQEVALPHGVSDMGVCIAARAIWKRTDNDLKGWHQLPSSDYSSGQLDGHVEYVNGSSIKFRLGSSLQYRMKQSTETVLVELEYTKQ